MAQATLQSVRGQANQRQFNPIYLVYGEEEYYHHEIVKLFEDAVVDAAVKDLNTDIFYSEDANGGHVLSACLALPMMSERRLVIVHDVEKLSLADPDRFIQYLQQPEQQTVVVFLAKKLNKSKNVHKALLATSTVINADPLKSEADVFQWLSHQFKLKAKPIDPDAIKLLYEHAGNNLYELSSHIEKLITFTVEEPKITAHHIEEIIGVSKEFNVYELQQAIIERNKVKTLSILKRLLEHGEDPIYLNSLIYYRFVKQWMLIQLTREKADFKAIMSALQLPQFVVKMHMKTANQFTLMQVNNILRTLKETDMKLKSTSTDSGQLLTFTVVKLMMN